MACSAKSFAKSSLRDVYGAAALHSSSCTTRLPFLYQTRSIQISPSRQPASYTRSTQARILHISTSCRDPNQSPTLLDADQSPPSENTDQSPPLHNPDQSPPAVEEDAWGPIPTQDYRNNRRSGRRNGHSRDLYGSEPQDLDQGPGRSVQDRFRDQRIQDVPFEHLATPLNQGRGTDQGTLTMNERRAFYRLFQSLAPPKENLGNGSEANRSAQHYNGMDYFGESDEPAGPYDASRDLEALLTGKAGASGEHMSPIERFPPALQNMAQQAEARMRLQQRSKDILQSQDDESDVDITSFHPALVKEREEAARIEADMRAAGTDRVLWAILEKEVFANIRLIQADEDTFIAGENARREQSQEREKLSNVRNDARKGMTSRSRPSKAAKRQPETESRTTNTTTHPPEEDIADTDSDEPAIRILDTSLPPPPTPSTQPLFTHQPAIYAHLTALALTLLTKRTAYTPLALALLPAIHHIGLTAYALCASTPLYNTLLAYQYRVLHASHAMLATLSEMDAAGVPADGETLAIVARVAEYRSAARSGQLGAMARQVEQLWGRAEEGKALAGWARRIEARLERRAVEGVKRRKAVGEMRSKGVFA